MTKNKNLQTSQKKNQVYLDRLQKISNQKSLLIYLVCKLTKPVLYLVEFRQLQLLEACLEQLQIIQPQVYLDKLNRIKIKLLVVFSALVVDSVLERLVVPNHLLLVKTYQAFLGEDYLEHSLTQTLDRVGHFSLSHLQEVCLVTWQDQQHYLDNRQVSLVFLETLALSLAKK